MQFSARKGGSEEIGEFRVWMGGGGGNLGALFGDIKTGVTVRPT